MKKITPPFQGDAPKMTHTFIAEDRKNFSVSGVTDVISFDDEQIKVVTTAGQLTIFGSNLAPNLDTETGEMTATGKLEKIVYSDNTRREPDNFLTKIFK